jgi:hypothetical protein
LRDEGVELSFNSFHGMIRVYVRARRVHKEHLYDENHKQNVVVEQLVILLCMQKAYIARPLKRLLDGVQIETETGHMGLIS